MKRKYTDPELIQAVQNSTSIRQVLTKLGLVEAGGNYSIIKHRIQELELSTSHFSGQGWKRDNRNPVVPARAISDLLQYGTRFQSYKLKKRIFAEGLKARVCESCHSTEWLGQPIPLEFDR